LLTEIHLGPDGSTPLEPDERAGLIPTYIATREELNAAEQANIADAVLGMRRRRLTTARVLDSMFLRSLHKAMFRDVWRWAGKYRTTERNIGVEPSVIAVSVTNLMADAASWVAPESRWLERDQAVCLLHHRLVAIHPFPNGNGRHARAFADLLMRTLEGEPFTWGAAGIQGQGPDRQAYLDALRAADADPENIDPLVTFARS
jgi:Fic-DOC domain mobile mystery protein B